MRVGIYSAERNKTYWGLSRLWVTEYSRQRDWPSINRDVFRFVHNETDGYKR